MHPKNAPKKVLVILIYPYIFHTKTTWNVVYKYLKTKIFSRDTNVLPLMYWTLYIFGPSLIFGLGIAKLSNT